MFFYLLFLFTVVPLLELFVLLRVGKLIGGWNTLGIVFITGIWGAYLARTQGRQVWAAVQSRLARGELPANHMIEGILVLIGGVLLVTPGFATDFVGLSMIWPWTRRLYVARMKAVFSHQIARGHVHVYTNTGYGSSHTTHTHEEFRQRPQVRDLADSEVEVIDVSPENSSADDKRDTKN